MALMKENESNKKEGLGRSILGTLLAILSFGFLVITCSGISGLVYFWSAFLDIPGLMIYFMLCLSGILISGRKSKEENLKVLQKIAIPNGVLLMMMQFIMMLHRLDDLSAVGPAVSVATLVVIYSIITYLAVTLMLAWNKKEEEQWQE